MTSVELPLFFRFHSVLSETFLPGLVNRRLVSLLRPFLLFLLQQSTRAMDRLSLSVCVYVCVCASTLNEEQQQQQQQEQQRQALSRLGGA